MDQAIYGLSYVEHLSYIGIFFAVAFSGYVIPVPEELILLLGGYLSALGFINIFFVIVVSFLGAITGDSVIYYLSGHGSRFTQKYHSRVEKTHLGWYLRHMKEHTWPTVFISRFIVGMRFFNPLVSGLLKVRWKTFVSAASASAAIYIPIVVLIGFFARNEINTVIHVSQSIQHLIGVLLVLGSITLVVFFIRNLIERRR